MDAILRPGALGPPTTRPATSVWRRPGRARLARLLAPALATSLGVLLLVPEAGSRQPGDAPATLAPSSTGSARRSEKLAQGPAAPTIEVVQVLLVEPGTDAPLSLQLKATGTLPPQSFIRIRGLPPATSLSEGHFVAPGVWAVPLSSLSTVRITVPAAQAGRSELSVSLVTADRKLVAAFPGRVRSIRDFAEGA